VKAAFLSRPVHPVTGKRIEIRADTRRELEARLHRLRVLRRDMRLGMTDANEAATSLRGLEKKRVTLLEAADSYAGQMHLAPATRNEARRIVRDQGAVLRGTRRTGALYELAGERLEALTAPRVAKHFRKLAEALAWSSVTAYWRKLRAIVRHAAEQGWIAQAPWGLWRPARPTHAKAGMPKRECCRSADERHRLYGASFAVSTRLAAVVAVGAMTGARKGELAGLRWSDVSYSASSHGVFGSEVWSCVVTLRRQGDGRALKRGEARTVDVPELGPALEAWRASAQLSERGTRASDPLFPNARGEHVRSGDVVNVEHLRSAVARAGLGDPKQWSLHSLRDSFVTIEAQRFGGDLRGLAARTGHRSIDSLLRYLQSFTREPRPVPALPPAPREAT
jgi:integrase